MLSVFKVALCDCGMALCVFEVTLCNCNVALCNSREVLCDCVVALVSLRGVASVWCNGSIPLNVREDIGTLVCLTTEGFFSF